MKFHFQLFNQNSIFSVCYLKESSDVLIHFGCTQEFYANPIDLDDHSETLLSFNFGVKSLYHLSVEYVEKYFNINQKTTKTTVCLK